MNNNINIIIGTISIYTVGIYMYKIIIYMSLLTYMLYINIHNLFIFEKIKGSKFLLSLVNAFK